jgi:protein CpxP
MDKTKLLTFSVIGLLLLNVGIICFLFFNRPHLEHLNQGSNTRTPKEIIIKKLHFDPNQINKYEKLIAVHRNKIDSLDNQIKALKSELYSQLKQTTINKKLKDSLINLLSTNETQIDETHFNHFQDIRNICTKEQLEDFNSLTEDLVKLFSNRSKPFPNENHSRPTRDAKHPNSACDENYTRPPRDENHPPHPPRNNNEE